MVSRILNLVDMETTNLQMNTTLRDRAKSLSTQSWIWITTAAVLLGGGGYYAHWAFVQDKFTAVTKHQLYRSARMDPEDLLQVVEDYGIRSVIDLRMFIDDPVGIEAERMALKDSDATYFHLPTGQVPSEETVLKFLNIVADPANRPVLVHCYHGTGRAVLFGSLYRIEFENWDNEKARRAVELFHWRGNFGPDSDKGRYLMAYRPHKVTVAVSARDSVSTR